jgi:hypothetical protein
MHWGACLTVGHRDFVPIGVFEASVLPFWPKQLSDEYHHNSKLNTPELKTKTTLPTSKYAFKEELAAHRQSYTDLAKTFDPVDFDPGFKYLMFTTVHCDGYDCFFLISIRYVYPMCYLNPSGRFINWPSNLTD